MLRRVAPGPTVALGLTVALALTGCAAGASDTAAPSSVASPAPREAAEWSGSCGADERASLLAMFEHDQSGRTGGDDPESDGQRTDRLDEMIAECGWPGFDDVGENGEEAAWTIAQHSDLDPGFQERALGLLRTAVEEGDASPGNLAYLEDRVLAGRGEPQVYGTQVACGPEGIEPAGGLVEPESVDDRREEAGLEPLADYLASFGDGFCG
jgi:hypothetical protein